MSIRQTKFNKEFMPLWKEISDTVSTIDSKGLSTEYRDEIAHLKKVTAYLTTMFDTIDPDFIPLKNLNSIKSPLIHIRYSLTNYEESSKIFYIKNINDDYMDTLLSDVMPFIFYKGRTGRALKNAINEYSQTINEHSQKFLDNIKISKKEVLDAEGKVNGILENISKIESKINNYRDDLFDDDGLENRMSQLVGNFEKNKQEIDEYYQQVFSEGDGIKDQVNDFVKNIKEQNQATLTLRESSSETLEELELFYKNIFGVENEDGERTGGLKNELEIRKNELNEFKREQQERYKELNKQIESLLPGATSAGLSSAYNAMHGKFSEDVKTYGHRFYGSLFLLLLTVGLVAYFVPNPMVMDPTKGIGHTLVYIFNGLIYRAPFVLPAIWLVLFTSRRRNEAQRLEQEYAHKESLAKSYESYKQQIEKLEETEKNKLLPILMENMLKAIAFNPASTLDKDNKEATPINEIVKNKDFWDFIEKIKNTIPLTKSKSD